MPKSPNLLSHSRSSLLIVDIQRKLLPVIASGPQVLAQSERLVQAADLFDVAISVTEQYPQGLGSTVIAFDTLSRSPARLEKTTFSCREHVEHFEQLKASGRNQIVICGIESHICVLQSAIDLKEIGLDVFLVADAIGSRDPKNTEWAIERCAQHGITHLPTESVLFEWCEDSRSDHFKSISKLVK